MFAIDQEKVKKRLLTYETTTESRAEQFLDNYPEIDDRLKPLYDAWIDSNEKDYQLLLDTDFEGITMRSVLNNRRIHFLEGLRELSKHMTLEGADKENQKKLLETKVFFE